MAPITLKGSCHCGSVQFTVESTSPVPYQLCLCSICRKVGGVGGSINLGGDAKSLDIKGAENLSVYNAVLNRGTADERTASSERNFCKRCSSMLWLYDKQWPELIHPFASAIDSPKLESPDTMLCIKLDSKPDYVRLPEGKKEEYSGYGPLSLAEWHKKNGYTY
ncbi:hypothetical protein D9619_013158 [Psilocybe cf. subviscida]|uniref:CENP-V/GFA domain-containing protein n=1 Tax=Psilocybe cf. subviscida TaxID=2480587 RepID=A0A8H5B8A9_9AGAR|nr:hypothetical protein D9619_013158 [Psilocybe cf. subviscida]